MKTKSIILRGGPASGKTLLAETIASVLEPKNVLRINVNRTIVGIIRDIHNQTTERNFDLIIADGCLNANHIKYLNQNLINGWFFSNKLTFKTVVYTTQDFFPVDLENVTLIDCLYKN